MARTAWHDIEAGNGIGGAPLLGHALPSRRVGLDRAIAWLQNAIAVLKLWHERGQQRRALAGLDERFLRDLGITRCDADVECSKPFWR
jgi:uncharacterized protein YjiS (DUF1127 family)